MPHLDDLAAIAAHRRANEDERLRLDDELREAIRRARNDGVTFTAIAGAVGLSLERVRQIYEGR